jgi:hypothetical protein
MAGSGTGARRRWPARLSHTGVRREALAEVGLTTCLSAMSIPSRNTRAPAQRPPFVTSGALRRVTVVCPGRIGVITRATLVLLHLEHGRPTPTTQGDQRLPGRAQWVKAQPFLKVAAAPVVRGVDVTRCAAKCQCTAQGECQRVATSRVSQWTASAVRRRATRLRSRTRGRRTRSTRPRPPRGGRAGRARSPRP